MPAVFEQPSWKVNFSWIIGQVESKIQVESMNSYLEISRFQLDYSSAAGFSKIQMGNRTRFYNWEVSYILLLFLK